MNNQGLIAQFYTEPLNRGKLILCPHCKRVLGALGSEGFIVTIHAQNAVRIYGNFIICCTSCALPIARVREATKNDTLITKTLQEERYEQ